MLYKVHKELSEVGTAARALISVILYNVCNVIEWGTRTGANGTRGVILHPCQHGGTKKTTKTGYKLIAARQPMNG